MEANTLDKVMRGAYLVSMTSEQRPEEEREEALREVENISGNGSGKAPSGGAASTLEE